MNEASKYLLMVMLMLMSPTTTSHLMSSSLNNTEEVTEETRNVFILVEGDIVSSTLINGVHAPLISVQLTFKGTSYTIDLSLNTYLVPSTYVDKIITESGIIFRQFNRSNEMCYYSGTIRGHEHSKAAFSTCERLRGFFVLDNFTFHVEPLQLESSPHIQMYEIKRVVNDHLSQWICGVKDLKMKFGKSSNQRKKRRIITESMDGQNVIELYVANDNRRLQFFAGNIESLSRSTREIVNTANLLYQAVGFSIVLVGTEHWTSDQIDVSTDSSATLTSWQSYRSSEIINKCYNDIGFLISRQNFDSNVLGLANIGTMCSRTNSGGIMMAIRDNSAVSGAILAHEIGHVFGLSHDSIDCYCESPRVSCIMSARASTDTPSLYFSSCSKSQFNAAIDKGFDICLRDLPADLSSHYPICGNGILEQGEECDCGRKLAQDCNPGCCNAITCKLAGQARCASGKCCDLNTCQPKRAGFQCRPAIGPCDLAEVCDGSSATCPANIYKHDGIGCNVDRVDSYCWGGMCRSQRSQCIMLFGSTVFESNPLCYQTFNLYGNINGWCSFKFGIYTRCQPDDVMCGALQCDTKSADLKRYTNFILQTTKSVSSYQCRGVVVDYGARVENPGMVPNGAPCGSGKMCVSQKCIPAEAKLNENPCPTCAHGICTNEGKCFCDPGYFGSACSDTSPETGGLSFGWKAAVGVSVTLILIVIIIIGLFAYKNNLCFKHRNKAYIGRNVPATPVKIASLKSNQIVHSVSRTGQENTAYESDICVISRGALVHPNARVTSYYPHSTDDQEDHYDQPHASRLQFVAPQSPVIQHPRSFKISLDPTTPPPPRPSVPPQHLKPPPPSKSLKPTAPSSRPPLPPASAKPSKETSHLPAKPRLPPQVVPSPPSFPSKPKPSRPAPRAPATPSSPAAQDGMTNAADVTRLRAMFEDISFI